MAEILIYDAIGSFFGEVSARWFAEQLAGVPKSERLTLRINSPGGEVFEGLAIYNLAKSHPGGVDVVIDGLAASAASFIAMVGQTITIHEGAMLMIHLPWGGAVGTSADLRRVAALLDAIVTDSNIPIYAARTKQSPEQIKAWLEAETWFGAAEAVQHGFADKLDAAASPAPPPATAKLAANWRDQTRAAALVKASQVQHGGRGSAKQEATKPQLFDIRELDLLAWELGEQEFMSW